MARTNGVDVAIALQRAFKGSPTPLPPIVAMTANTSAQDVARWVLCCRSINMLQIQLEHPPAESWLILSTEIASNKCMFQCLGLIREFR